MMCNGTHVYRCGESMTIVNADAHREHIVAAFNDPLVTRVVLDFSSVRVCDSCGIRTLLSAQRLSVEVGKPLLILRPDLFFRDMIKSVKLDSVLTLVSEVDGLDL